MVEFAAVYVRVFPKVYTTVLPRERALARPFAGILFGEATIHQYLRWISAWAKIRYGVRYGVRYGIMRE